jgi:uncharacterized membrane protein
MARDWSDYRIEEIVGNLLRTGVMLSAAVVLVGGFLYLARTGFSAPHYGVFRGEPSDLKNLRGILRGVSTLDARSIIQLGLVLLIATPVARVAFSIWGFAAERDRMYVAFTSLVLVILLYSLLGSGSAF